MIGLSVVSWLHKLDKWLLLIIDTLRSNGLFKLISQTNGLLCWVFLLNYLSVLDLDFMLDLEFNELVLEFLSIFVYFLSNDFSDLNMFCYNTYLFSNWFLELIWTRFEDSFILLKSFRFIWSLLVSKSMLSKFI